MTANVKLLVVGGGSIGERHVRCAQSTRRTQVALCEVKADVRQAVADRYDLSAAFADLDEAIQSRHDAAVVATPAHSHVEIARQLVDAGVHVLIEKPLSTTMDGIDGLADAAYKQDVWVAVAYVYRAHPVLAAMRDAILSGRFGRPVQIVAVSGQHFPHYRPAYRETYYTGHATGGGAIQDALTHLINAGEWLLGPVTELAADAAHQVLEGVGVEDTVHVIARHDDVLGSYSLNQHQAPNETTMTVMCERGAARFEAHANRWRWMVEPESEWHDEPHSQLERDSMFVRQANAFLDAVEGKSPPLCSLDEGLQTLRVNLATLRAVHERSWQLLA